MPKPLVKNDEIEFLLCDVANIWRKVLNSHTDKLGIRACERRVLYAIKRFPGSTQVHIADLVDLEPQSLTRILDKLEANQWIEKRNDQQDRRVKRLYCTQAAEPLIVRIQAIGDDMIRPKALTGVDEDALDTMYSVLLKVKHNLLDGFIK